MSSGGVGVVEAMFSGVEALREGIISLQREIDRLQAENAELKGRMADLQEQVEQAKRYIESVASASASASSDYRGGRMERILPHDEAAREAAIKEAIALEKRKKGGL